MGSLVENSAPRFVHKPQLRQEDDGNRLIFECELAGFPQPDIYWFRGDSTISEDDRTFMKVIKKLFSENCKVDKMGSWQMSKFD